MAQAKKFIVWYMADGEEDYMIITAHDEDEARRRFYSWHDNMTEMHEIQDSEAFLAYV